MQNTQAVRLNALGLARLNADRRARRLPEITSLPAVPVGQEPRADADAEGAITKVGAASPTSSGVVAAVESLPSAVDNSTMANFPEVRTQGDILSCASFSTTYYVGTHMTGMARGWTNVNGDNTRKFSPKWSYNFTNGGENVGTWFTSVFDVLLKLGAPTWADFPYSGTVFSPNYREWSRDAALWRSAVSNRFSQVGRVQNVDTDAGLAQVKALLNNGYLLLYATNIDGWQLSTFSNDPTTSADNAFAGVKVCSVAKTGTSGHAMTIVGYNDNLWVDINKNGIVDAGEKGALKIVNSWGTSWGVGGVNASSDGFAWIAYDALRLISAVAGGDNANRAGSGNPYLTAFWGNEVYWITARPSYTPTILGQFTLTHAKRDQLWIRLGRSATTVTTPASYWPSTTTEFAGWQNASDRPETFRFLGGPYGFGGSTSSVAGTFVFDLTDLVVSGNQRYYLEINDSFAGSAAAVSEFRLLNSSGATLATASNGIPLSADGSTSRAYVDFAVNSPPVITSVAAATATVGQSFTYTITATNGPTGYSASNLPPGLSLNATTGVISGTPMQTGTFVVSLGASNASGTGSGSLTLAVNQALLSPPSINSATTASGTVGQAFAYTITATNSPTSFGATGLPSGLTVNATTGVISGTPTQAGIFTVTLSAANAGGPSTRGLVLTIASAPVSAPVITSAANASGVSGAAFTYRIEATNNPTSFGAIDLPSGLTLNISTGVISGTLPVARSYGITLAATNSTGTGYKALVLQVTGGSSFGPSNDAFANRIPLDGATASSIGTNVNATAEPGESAHAGAAATKSAWWSWTSPGGGLVTIDTIGSSFDTVLGVYTGTTVSALSVVASDDQSGGNNTSRVSFTVSSGATYQIAVDGWAGATGLVKLNIAFTGSGPANDTFANRVTISGATASASGTNVNATAQTGEPAHAANTAAKSVWWTWTASQTGRINIDTIGSSFDTVLAVYTGTAVNALTAVASDDQGGGNNTSRVSFNVTSGTVYQIAVDGWLGSEGTVKLNISIGGAGPTNDAFANRIALSGATANVSGSNLSASAETNEPAHAGYAANKSVWWTWTAPGNGQVIVDTIGSSFDTLLAVYKGSTLASLANVASDDDNGGSGASRVTLNVTAGTVYQIAVDGWLGYEGSVQLHVAFNAVSVTNDAFANRIVLSSASASVATSNASATAETGEPAHAGNPAAKSVWWSWTAPANGTATINTTGSSFDTLLAVYRGASLGSLLSIASDDESGGNHASALKFFATAGTTYFVAVDGWGGASGSIVLNLSLALSSDLYFTDFESFPTGTDLLAGRDGWASTNTTDALSGLFQGFTNSRTAFLGFNPTSAASVLVWRPIGYDPVAAGTPVVQFTVDFAVIDSTNGQRDDFYFDVYNFQGLTLGAIHFANSNRRIYRYDGTSFQDVGSFVNGTRYALVATMDFAANRWSATLGGTTLFTNQPISAQGRTMALGGIDAGWLITTPGLSGNNYLVFDNFRIAAAGSVVTAVTSVATGFDHTEFVKSDGTLWAMGWNADGQLGDGTTTSRSVPVQIASGVVSVAADGAHTTFVKADGTLWATGWNDYGQLGDGTTTSRSTPVQVASGVAAVAAGTYHTVFVKTNGTAWTVGRNDNGQLGDGTTTLRIAPVQFANGVASVTAGGFHTMFVKTDGTLWAVGNNSYGQLGDGTTTSRSAPVQVASGVGAVAAGFTHTMFVKTDGTLWAVGDNNSGQLGNGTTTSRSIPVLVASGVASVVAGTSYTLFVKVDGTLWAMGYNAAGQLGDGTTTNRNTPVQIASAVASAAAGDDHTMFVRFGGTLWAMGDNHRGQLGDGTVVSRSFSMSVAGPIAPALTTSGGVSAFTEGNNVTSAPIAIDPALTVSSGTSTLASGTVSITANFQSAEDVLGFSNAGGTMGNITGTYSSSTGVLTLTSTGATATLAHWQSALRAVTYTNVSDAPNTANRTISFVVIGGMLSSTPATKTVSITAVNDAPTVSNIANQTVNEDTATSALVFTVGDGESAAGSLTLSGGSSNTTLVPNANIVFGGSGASRTVTVTPAANLSGTATISVTVSDGALTANDTFVLTVNAVNDPPTISDIANQTANQDTATNALTFTIGDVETVPGSLTMSGSSSNTTLVPNANVVFGGSGANRTVTVTPATNQSGTTTITVTVSDGALTASDTFVLTVVAPNQAPTISDIANQTILTGANTGSLAFTVGDLETAAGSLTVTASSSNTTLIPTANIVFGGSGANRTVMVTAAAGQNGSATITVTVSDGALTVSDTFVVTVQPNAAMATHAVVGAGYISGGNVTIANTLSYAGTLSTLGWSVPLPSGWSYASGSGSEGDGKPAAGAVSLLDWNWTTIPPSPVVFSYTLNVPAGTTGNKTIPALISLTKSGSTVQVLAQPDPLIIPQITTHSADTDRDFQISLFELTRVIELYNTRNGTVRTGCYKLDPSGEDGFAADATRSGGSIAALVRYHSADTRGTASGSPPDGAIDLFELTRVIELYNTRSGTVRTGRYHRQENTEDGFAAGP